MPCIEYYLEKGLSKSEARQRVADDVFGVGFKTDSQGRPIEQGIGSAAQPTEQHLKAIERYEGRRT